MNFVIFGASGLIGSELTAKLRAVGQKVTPVTTNPDKPGYKWNPDEGVLPPEALEEADVVINLAGASVAGKRWSKSYKEEIRDSRVKGSELIANTINKVRGKDCTFVSVSGLGIYGHSPGTKHLEESAPGDGFLADVAVEWEAASNLAECRVIIPRISMVLSAVGGAMDKMLPVFKLGLGGIVGDGKQVWSWIAIEDVIQAILWLLPMEDQSGVYNFCSPNPATNAEFTKALGEALNRPTVIPLPAFAAKLMLGEMADELLLASIDAFPKKLIDAGYEFRHPDIETLPKMLGLNPPPIS